MPATPAWTQSSRQDMKMCCLRMIERKAKSSSVQEQSRVTYFRRMSKASGFNDWCVKQSIQHFTWCRLLDRDRLTHSEKPGERNHVFTTQWPSIARWFQVTADLNKMSKNDSYRLRTFSNKHFQSKPSSALTNQCPNLQALSNLDSHQATRLENHYCHHLLLCVPGSRSREHMLAYGN